MPKQRQHKYLHSLFPLLSFSYRLLSARSHKQDMSPPFFFFAVIKDLHQRDTKREHY